jgi:hypothetical protein
MVRAHSSTRFRLSEELQLRVVWSYSHSSLAMERDAKVILGHRPVDRGIVGRVDRMFSDTWAAQ